MALGIAFRAFFSALFHRDAAKRIQLALDSADQTPSAPKLESLQPIPEPAKPQPPAEPQAPAKPQRSDALTLLATLQREARLIDLIKENLSAYSDAQIGAAARPCLQQCAGTLDRLFAIQPTVAAPDGQNVTVPENATPSRYLWIGEGSGQNGKLVHHGWEATRVELPQWTGADADANVIAPAQVQRA
jgi:hypothetical protein